PSRRSPRTAGLYAAARSKARPRADSKGFLRLCGFCAARELLDLAFGAVELLLAEAVELLAPLPEFQGLVERRLAGFESPDDLLELLLGLFEGHRVSSTRAPKPPSTSSARSGTTRRAATLGVEARASAARSQSGVSCSWPTAETTGTGQFAIARTSRSSLKGSRSSKLPPPRATTITSTSGSRQSAPR